MRLKYYYLFFISVTAFVVWIFFSFSKENLADKEIIKECVSFYTLDYDLNFNDSELEKKINKYLHQTCAEIDIIRDNKYIFKIDKNDSLLVFSKNNLFNYPKSEIKLFPNNKNQRCLNKNMKIGFYSNIFEQIDNINEKNINQYLIKNTDSLVYIPLFSGTRNRDKYAIYMYEDGIVSISCSSNININLLNKINRVLVSYISNNEISFDYALIPIVVLDITPAPARIF